MNEPPLPQDPDEPQQQSLLETRPLRTQREPESPSQGEPPAATRQRPQEQGRRRDDPPERQQQQQRRRQPEAIGPAPPRQPRAVRGESGGEVSLKTIALIAFVFGVFLHGCVAWSFLDDEGLPTEDRPSIVVTSTAAPQATATATTLPDRTTCDEIRGTEYRSEAERDFFRRNCISG